jgi:lysozyme
VYPDKRIYGVEGLDVSHHQEKIDWKRVDEKYRFVFIKATEGDTFKDRRFQENIREAKRSGRITGAYHFFHFNYDGKDQAENFIQTAGKQIDLPPAVDFEFSGNPRNFDKEKVIKELKKCASRLEEYYGARAIIYTTSDAYNEIIRDNFDNPIWYRSILFPAGEKKNLIFWQYHNSAIIEGVKGRVDLNVFKGTAGGLRDMLLK